MSLCKGFTFAAFSGRPLCGIFMKTTRTVEYKTLRIAFQEVKKFLEAETFKKVTSLKTKIADDLHCTGDDNYELLEKFVIKYGLSTKGFDYQKHFLTEYELYGSFAALTNFIGYLLNFLHSLLRFFNFEKIENKQIKIEITKIERKVSDMTVGDLVTWYLEKDYHLREEFIYQIKNTA